MDSYTLIVVPLPAEAETCNVRAALGAGDAMSLCVRNSFWRGEKIHELGGRRLTKLAIIGYPPSCGGRHMGYHSSPTAFVSTQLNRVFTRDMIDTVVGSNEGRICSRVV
jgi:hypothetical protein